MQRTVRYPTEISVPVMPAASAAQTWEEDAPYTKMASDYRSAAEKLLRRRDELRQQLAVMRRNKAGTAESARAQTVLEQRIGTLTEEYIDAMYVIRQIQPYAEREVQR